MKKFFTDTLYHLSLGALLLGSFVNVGFAGANATANLLVQVNVVAACTVTTSPVQFAPYISNSPIAVTGNGTISVNCSNGVTYYISLNEGLNKGSSSTPTAPLRNMVLSTNKLSYQLFWDNALSNSTIWGAGTQSSGYGTNFIGTGSSQPYTVYGSIPANQNLATTGNYSDTVVVTINVTN